MHQMSRLFPVLLSVFTAWGCTSGRPSNPGRASYQDVTPRAYPSAKAESLAPATPSAGAAYGADHAPVVASAPRAPMRVSPAPSSRVSPRPAAKRRAMRSDASGGASSEAPSMAPPVTTSSRRERSAPRADDSRGMAYPSPPMVARPLPRPRARLLTAASVADADRYNNYMSYLSRHARERNATGLVMNRRVRIRVLDRAGRPINNAKLEVQAGGQLTIGHTRADGHWAYLPSLVGTQARTAWVTASAGQRAVRARVSLPSRGDAQQLTLRLPVNAIAPKALDLAFVIDITGSMSDELRYVNGEVADIVRRVRLAVPNTDIRVSGVFYRDRSDSRPLEILRFTRNVRAFGHAMQRIRASGGGDYPEDMDAGLNLAMHGLDWRRGNVARVMVLIADAPPKRYANARYNSRAAMLEASARGIRILPVAASGSNRTVEYLFRAMGVATSTPYVYLTDDSGVGNAHMEADTDRVGVERFNDLLTRLMVADLRGQGMHEPGQLGPR